MSYRVGVDLGTTFTAAAVANGQPPTMVGLGNRALQIPSVLYLAPDGEFVCGESAERRGLAEPDRVVREFKRRIGDTVPILVAGSPYSAQSLTARLLRHVWQTTRDRMGSAPDQVVLTHPANWGPYKLELLDQVASLADIGQVIRCPEPVAAAAQYATRNLVEVGDTIAVYDLGGGTFDACVLSKTSGGFDLVGVPEGIEHLGGIDFDEALFQHALNLLGSRLTELDPDDPETTRGLNRLRRDCVDCKEALSSDSDAVLPVALPGLSTTLRLTRSEFEGLIRPALEETVDSMARALRSAGVPGDRLSAIVLIGGSSRIPLVGELLQQRFGVPTALDTHPKHDVALGAVQLGSSAASPARTTSVGRADDAAPSKAFRYGPGVVAPPPPRPAVTTPPSPATSSAPAVRQSPPNGPPSSPVPGSPAPDPRPDRAVNLRRGVIIGGVAAVLIAGVVAGVVVINRPDAGPAGNPASSGLEESSPAASRSPSATVNAAGLPISAPLADSQLVVPAKIDDNWDLWLADSKTATPVARLTIDPATDSGPVISPDRRTVIYTQDLNSDGKRTLLVKGAASPGDGRVLFSPMPSQCAGTVFRPAWNPVVPEEIAVPCINAKGNYGLYRFTVDGQLIAKVPVPAGTVRVDDPTYSPDGSTLAYWAAPDSGLDGGTLYTVAVDGGTPEVLVPSTEAGEDADPEWSPDGSHVAFRRRVADGTSGGNFDVFTVTTDGTARLNRLTEDPADEQNPNYSPDGTQIAYKSAAPDPAHPDHAATRVWLMGDDGANKAVLWPQGPDPEQNAAAWGLR